MSSSIDSQERQERSAPEQEKLVPSAAARTSLADFSEPCDSVARLDADGQIAVAEEAEAAASPVLGAAYQNTAIKAANETIIYMRPERVAKNRIAQLDGRSPRQKIFFRMFLTFIFLFFLQPCWAAFIPLVRNPLALAIVMSACSAAICYLLAMLIIKGIRFGPDRIRLSDEGIRLQWKRRLWCTSPIVPWSQISYVGVTQWRGLIFCDNWMDLHVQTSSMATASKEFFSWFFRDFWTSKQRCRMYVDLEAIVLSDEAKKLFEALTRYLPPERIDPQLLELLNPLRPESYTELWMSSLASSAPRLRLEGLNAGATLHDGEYRIIRQLGGGGQGVAYLARRRSDAALLSANGAGIVNGAEGEADGYSSETVVLKEFILPSHGGGAVKSRSLSNVEREAQLLKQIAHPHIVHIIDLFVEDERAYLVLEHIDGKSLRALVEAEGPVDEERARQIALQLCDILAHLHKQEPPVIHRDFTPENIMIKDADGSATLIDFNVAQQLQSTATRTVVGKHSYIPPEQFRGKATPRSDIYALGATLAFMLTGRDPEPISSAHPKQANGAVSDALDEIVARATSTDETERYADVTAVRDDLAA